ncbi:MAG: hypothetical protein ACOX5G_02305 [Kiritimatiellia bacterium]|jgi:uncharacterized lipoprotein YddW (UPF0748 family)
MKTPFFRPWRLFLPVCLVLSASFAFGVELLAPSAARVRAISAGSGTPRAVFREGAYRLPLAIPDGADRIYWDIPFSAPLPPGATVLVLDLSMPSIPGQVRSFSLHVKSGKGWYLYPDSLSPQASGKLKIPLPMFKPEGTPGPLSAITAMRISAWRDAGFRGKPLADAFLSIASVAAFSSPIAIVKSTDATAPGETAFAGRMADRSLRAFLRAGYAPALVDDTFADLPEAKLLVLPYSPKLSDAAAKRLCAYVAKGGKLMVHYSASAPLARLFGIHTPVWGQGPGKEGYSAMVASRGVSPAEGGEVVPHRTTSVLLPRPLKGSKAGVRAVWLDSRGNTTGDPACVLSDAGAWFAHVPPLPSPAAAGLLRGVVRSVAPSILALPLDHPRPARLVAAVRPHREIRGIWFPSPAACHPKGWDGLFADLASTRLCNTAFIRLQSSGTALYPSGGKLPERLPGGASRVEDIVAAGRKHGIAVHAWTVCWDASEAADLPRLRKEGLLMKDEKGKEVPWRCPDHPRNGAELQAAILDAAARGAHIELDFIRYSGSNTCYCETTRRAFEKALGRRVADWPAEVMAGGPLQARFRAFRAQSLTSWIAGLRDVLKRKHPGIRLSTTVYADPASGSEVGQAWPAWAKAGLVDFVSPMIYVENDAVFASHLSRCKDALENPGETLVPGIGVSSSPSQLDIAQTVAQLNVCRSQGLRGYILYAYDASLAAILRAIEGGR